MDSSTNSHTHHDVNIDYVTQQQVTMYEQEITTLEREVERLQRMLYTMTSLRDWQLAGYDSAEYDALYAKFENEEGEVE